MKKKDMPKREPVDWDLLKRRIASVGDALSADVQPSPERLNAILRDRARALAQEQKPALGNDAQIEVLEFGLANERYAVETKFVHEVYALHELTPLPCTPPFVLGIANLHGRIISVIDIKRFFDLPRQGLSDLNKVIVLHGASMEFGVLTDQIFGANCLPVADIQQSVATLTGIRSDYLKGVTKDRLIVLDAYKLLTDRRIIVNEEVVS